MNAPAAVGLHRAGPLEAGVVAALQQACFPEEPWDEASVASLIAPPGGFAVLALAGPQAPVGFVMTRVAAEDAEILAIGVMPDARRGGVGRLLVEAAVEGARDLGATAMFLEVAEDNPAASTLYKACGFFSVGRRPGYYKRPDGRVAALVLRRNLDGA
ncbi:GNAT family N-acetyltransferase [Azospirillum picis]|uniref:Ribosomal-protein-alanine N-acetyltransferase n=1 Tax=Azospirillum picis TaxID=488438 RepID=A0ABU0MLV1_9PROT|nr:GNAT family N-acetyltransferase [Azospirillum picis]MBP2300428.1 ribosomal-protein-alanine N-acetyltransferase [Azospirillum picis]MDQ0534224.1 ribosomal-protein-alanine N-acetyltransferase [Azospirillum picis]